MSEERVGDKILRKLYEKTVNNGIESIDKYEIGKEIGIIDVQMDNLVDELTSEGYIKKTCHWLLTNLPNLEKTAQKHGIRLLNTLGISTNSSRNIMLHAILQTNTGYQITLNSHPHHYYYPQFFIGPKSICILSTFEPQFDHKCNKLWS